MNRDESVVSDLACWAVAAVFVFGLAVLALRLKEVQVEDAADYSYANVRQSVRRVQTDGDRGRIIDRNGVVLADNRKSVSIVCKSAFFQKRTWEATVDNIEAALSNVAAVVGSPSPLARRDISRHINQTLAMPLAAWRDVGEKELARFCEHDRELPGFSVLETEERVYPQGRLASHLIGYVGRDRGESEAGDEKFNFYLPEMRGRSGLEIYYDSFLRGVSGERRCWWTRAGSRYASGRWWSRSADPICAFRSMRASSASPRSSCWAARGRAWSWIRATAT